MIKTQLNPTSLYRVLHVIRAVVTFLALFPLVLVLYVGSSIRRLWHGRRPFTCLVQWSLGNDEFDKAEVQGDQQGTVVQRQPSGTAFSSAFFKHHAYLEGLNDDDLVGRFLPISARIVCRWFASLSQMGVAWLVDLSTSGYHGYSICATRFFDDLVFDAFLLTQSATGANKTRFEQIVNLGAGLDTRLFRLAKKLEEQDSGLEHPDLFEVDVLPMYHMKRYLVTTSISRRELSHQPRLVAVDFARDNIIEQLEQVGFDRNRKTLFLMECVSFYLTKEAIRDTFHLLSTSSPPESVIAFDYMEDTWSDHRRRLRATEVFGATSAEKCRRAGEPFRFGLDVDETPQQVFEPLGPLRVINHLRPKDYIERYLLVLRPPEGQEEEEEGDHLMIGRREERYHHRSSEKCHLCVLEVTKPDDLTTSASTATVVKPLTRVATGAFA